MAEAYHSHTTSVVVPCRYPVRSQQAKDLEHLNRLVSHSAGHALSDPSAQVYSASLFSSIDL
jgi:hypothetical protein